MNSYKLFKLNHLLINKRKIYPIAKLYVNNLENLYIKIKYSIVAICIHEEDRIYYKNISLTEYEFNKIKK